MTSKQKFSLTSDLVKVESEHHIENDTINLKNEKTKKPEQINVKITSELKLAFQIWCLNNKITMSDAIVDQIKQVVSWNDED